MKAGPVNPPQKIFKVMIHVLSSLQILNDDVWFKKNRNHS